MKWLIPVFLAGCFGSSNLDPGSSDSGDAGVGGTESDASGSAGSAESYSSSNYPTSGSSSAGSSSSGFSTGTAGMAGGTGGAGPAPHLATSLPTSGAACDTVNERVPAYPEQGEKYCVCGESDSGLVWICTSTHAPAIAPCDVDQETVTGGDDGSCLVTWECASDRTYGLVCFDTGCSCQANGVTSPLVDEGADVSNCDVGLDVANSVCWWWDS